MAITLQEARELSLKISKNLAGNQEKWRQFLKVAGNLYKYLVEEQLMIHTQRPDASMTASYETWKSVGHFVKGNSFGIALFKGDGEGLKYVFDVSDTDIGHSNVRNAFLPWKMKKRHSQTVFNLLESEYGVSAADKGYPERLRKIVSVALDEKLSESMEHMEQESTRSLWKTLPQEERLLELKKMVETSASYIVFSRMGLVPMFRTN